MAFTDELAKYQVMLDSALRKNACPESPSSVIGGLVPGGRSGDGPRTPPERLALACEHALLGGKRLRPFVLLNVAEMLGTDARAFIKAACAVECVHTSSLIIDDLPCMDDSATRRQSASLHRQFGEATAILTSICLLTRGFELLAENAMELGVDVGRVDRTLICLGRIVGAFGMAAGQMIELTARANTNCLATMEFINGHKTGTLFAASAQIPAMLTGAPQADVDALGCYGSRLGQAYQITDDILDSSGPCQALPLAQAAETQNFASNNASSAFDSVQHPSGTSKNTLASFLGASEAHKIAAKHIADALSFIERYGRAAEPLRQLAQFVLSRNQILPSGAGPNPG